MCDYAQLIRCGSIPANPLLPLGALVIVEADRGEVKHNTPSIYKYIICFFNGHIGHRSNTWMDASFRI